jgi:hypothetical protein
MRLVIINMLEFVIQGKFGSIAEHSTMRPKIVVRDALIIFVLTFVGGFGIGVARGLYAVPENAYVFLIACSNLLFCTIGFTISAARSPTHRWKHVLLVALCVWPMGLLNVFFGITLVQWFFGIIFILLTMALGGALSYLFNSRSTSVNNCVNRSGDSGGA